MFCNGQSHSSENFLLVLSKLNLSVYVKAFHHTFSLLLSVVPIHSKRKYVCVLSHAIENLTENEAAANYAKRDYEDKFLFAIYTFAATTVRT